MLLQAKKRPDQSATSFPDDPLCPGTGTTTEAICRRRSLFLLPFGDVVLVREEFAMHTAGLRDPSFVLACAAIAICLAVIWWAFELGPF